VTSFTSPFSYSYYKSKEATALRITIRKLKRGWVLAKEGYIMINVTERARQELRRILSETVDMPQARLRIMDRGQGELGLGLDIEALGDHIVEYEGLKVLVVEPGLAANLKGVTLDVDDTVEGPEMVICYESDSSVNNVN